MDGTLQAARLEEIGHVIAIGAYLEGWVEYGEFGYAGNDNEIRITFVKTSAPPMLKFDDHIGVVTRGAVDAGEDYIGPLTRGRQLVLDQHLYVAEVGFDQITGQQSQSAFLNEALAGTVRPFCDALLVRGGSAEPASNRWPCCEISCLSAHSYPPVIRHVQCSHDLALSLAVVGTVPLVVALAPPPPEVVT
ncbi:hypothetical protein [Microbispora sp. KK1-11]|uniref:hypothetical protein n=1 Tax=Microbispora sp. KK1-11 TaxID=2053005 RepID=UPI0021AE6899|nr:hypothetical protein [Microbispora sp. KK1-11]